MENFVNFHVLISHSPACLNRDDMNMQKSAVFGGVRRVRISSQSLKRALRKSSYYRQHFGEPSVRTRNLSLMADFAVGAFADRFDRDLIERSISLFSKSSSSDANDDDPDADSSTSDGGQDSAPSTKVAVAPWVLNELGVICEAVRACEIEGLSSKEVATIEQKHAKQKGKKKKDLESLKEEALAAKIAKHLAGRTGELSAALQGAMDVALSGRMATSGLMTSIDGALAVAHAITTHAVDSDIDWFTAVDDLVSDAGETGAGHLNTQEFSSGVFYRYASLNLGQLQKNLGGASRERALDVARHVAHLLATVVPSAKQQTFAAHNLADCVLVSFSDQPISLANAFELPVKAREKRETTGFRAPSQKRLLDHWTKLNEAYGLNERAAAFCLEQDGELPSKLAATKSLRELTDWIAADGRA